MTKQNRQNRFERILYFSALVYAEFYLLPCVFRHMIHTDKLIDSQQWCALILALAALVYLFTIKLPTLRNQEEKERFLNGFCSYEQVYVIYVFFWYILSVALYQYRFGGTLFLDNDLWMFITGLAAFLFFPFARYAGREKAKQTIEYLLHSLVIPFAVFSIWLIWNYFRQNYVMFPSGRQLQVEAPAILFYTGVNHVSIGRQAFVMLGISLYMIITQKPVIKILYTLCFAIFFVFLILTNVRTSWYMATGMLASAAFLFCWNRLENQKMLTRIAAGILLAAAVGLCCHLLREETFLLLGRAWANTEQTDRTESAAETEACSNQPVYRLQMLGGGCSEGEAAQTELQRLRAEQSSDEKESEDSYVRRIDNNLFSMYEREALYRASFFAMFTSRHRFLFGVTPSRVGLTLNGIWGVNRIHSHAHNFFLQMGVAFGFPTMLATIVFAVSLFIRSIRIIFINRKKVFSGAWMICLMVLFFLGNDMFESGLNASPDFFCPAFYLFAGWLTALDMDTRSPKKNGKHAWF